MNIHAWDEILKFLDVLTRWPAVALYLALIFRGAIARKLSGIEKIKVKDAEVIFAKLKAIASTSRPELLQQAILKLPLDAILDAEAEDTPETSEQAGVEDVDEEDTEDDAERVELELQWRSVRKKQEEPE